MKKRQIIIIAAAILIVVLARIASNAIGEPKERPKPVSKEKVNTVFADTVSVDDIPILVQSTGRVEALERAELFGEVQGIMIPDGGKFRAGNNFRKGEVLIVVKSDDQQAQVVSIRSEFLRALTAVMPDIRLDHSSEYDRWSDFLSLADAQEGIPPLPEVLPESLERFLTGKGILSSYYSVRAAEAQLRKYRLTAPFDGVLTEALVDPGTVIRPGQRVGLFIRPGIYELETAVDLRTIERISIGQDVTVSESETGRSWKGKVTRVNPALDSNSQLCSFFTRLEDKEIRDGMYLEAQVQARTAEDAFTVSRSTLLEGDAVYVIRDGILQRQPIQVVHIANGQAVVQGLDNGMLVLEQVPPDAFEGMRVEVYRKGTDS